MQVTRLWLPIQECLSRRQCGGTEEHRASAGPCAIQVEERRGEFGPRVDHKSRQAVNYGNHKNHGGLRVSAVKAVLLVVIDVEDGSPARPLISGYVCKVSIAMLSACSNNLRI